MIASEDLSDNLQLVVFSAGEDEFGLEIAQVHEIIRLQPITRIPRAADCVEGVINLRGNVVPVLNLHQRLGLSPRTDTERTRIIVAQVGEVSMGIVVDGVAEVITIPSESIEPPTSGTSLSNASYLRGIGKLGERLVLLLDLEVVLGLEQQP